MYEPLTLQLWTHPRDYFGAVWPATYVFLSQNRDSDTLTRSNFVAGLEALGGESDTVQVVRESHWACGWVEWIAINQDDTEALKVADDIATRLCDYPVVNEDHWSELEWTEGADYWESMSVRDRAHAIERSGCGASLFAARRGDLPQDDNGALLQYLNGC